ncbi:MULTISPECIES: outer membrane protein [Alphaproteobacteria]|uniref:Outer membrane protein n=2 Tax=Alphaproteobacteria TaxID=28211 RepID=A0A512HGJ2_9HYPH|nr:MULTISPECIES: outer membrane protein [Alphaproteobacteria]GEO84568.1 outer membrane protein [Ciceribacter naphthalenivorans]GLR22531.1 outer membrane protein [Ciceribacter naphthalenivorans]GLT05387.1 outer membrane protein [Sphingomonas psychrolutea]
MRTLTMILLASATALMASQAARAADAVDQIPEAPVATESYAAPAGNWTGAYVGGAVTYDWGRFDGSNSRDADAAGGSLYGGYNMQNGQIVYGAEADIGYNGEKGSAGAGLEGKQGVNGSLRARVGYDMNPFLIYGTGGIAAANHKIESATDKDEKAAVGYTVGAGVEALVTDNIMARVEYRYTDYASRDFKIDGANVSRGFDDHSVKVGIGMKF